jgi:hypothetical protein
MSIGLEVNDENHFVNCSFSNRNARSYCMDRIEYIETRRIENSFGVFTNRELQIKKNKQKLAKSNEINKL